MDHLPTVPHDKNYFEALDGWRGICASMVALFHFRAYSHLSDSSIIKAGGNFLDFFFVLSGFVIFANYYDRLKSGYPLRHFMWLRFGRLYPLHFFVLMLFIGGDAAQLIFPFLQKGATFLPFHGPGEGPRYIVANLLLLHSFGVTDFISLNAPSWSISAEFYTYLAFALFIYASKGRPSALALATVIMFLFMLAYPARMSATSNLGVLRSMYGFGCGAAAWLIYRKTREKIASGKTVYFNVAEMVFFVGVFIFLHVILLYLDVFPHLMVFSPLLFSCGVYLFAYQKGVVSKLLISPVFSLLGALSYSIYMMHMFISAKIFYGLGHLIQKITGIAIFSAINGADTLGTSLKMGDAFYVIYFLSVVAASFISYRLIEVPCRNWFRRKIGRSVLEEQKN